ncbi:MAG: SMI1/KNR4 family protein [Pseudomonadota bacterium]
MTFEETAYRILSSCKHFGAVDPNLINAAEAELGCVFPKEYRAFLESFGAAWLPGVEISGVVPTDGCDGPPLWDSVVRFAQQAQRTSNGRISREMIPIASDGMEVTFYLSTRGENCRAVQALGPGVNEWHPSFSDFVANAHRYQ